MRFLRSTLFNLAFYGFTLILALAATPFALIGARIPLRRLFRFWAGGTLALTRGLLGARIEIRGRAHMPQGGALIIGNHQSELDGILMARLTPELAPVAMAELERYPFFGPILRALGFLLVRTEGERGQSAAVAEAARAAVAEGRQVLIYPEGRLMPVGERAPMRSGVWRIYHALQAPAHLVAQDLGRIWPRREWVKNPGAQAVLEFLPPIPPGLGKEDFMLEVERRLEAAVSALEAEHAAACASADSDSGRLARGGESGEPATRPGLPAPAQEMLPR